MMCSWLPKVEEVEEKKESSRLSGVGRGSGTALCV